MPREAATSLMRQSVVPACWFSATMGLSAAVGVGLVPAAEGGAGPRWRAAPMYPAPMRTASDTTAARRPLRTRAEFVILPAASAAIEGSSRRSLPGVDRSRVGGGSGGAQTRASGFARSPRLLEIFLGE